MKKKITFTLLIIFGILISVYLNISYSKKAWKDLEVPSDEILLIRHYMNFAGDFQHDGIFIDSEGGVYSFDFSENSNNYKPFSSTVDFINTLHIIRASEEPIATLNDSLLKELYWYVSNININSEFTKTHRACDAGSDSIDIYDRGAQTLITCYETGDYDGKLQDKYAKKLCYLFNRKIQPIITSNIVNNISKKS